MPTLSRQLIIVERKNTSPIYIRLLSELEEQKQVAQYVTMQYPKVIFNTSMSGVNLGEVVGKRYKDLGNKKSYPDFFFAEPLNGYHGLYIEYKKTGEKLFKKDGITYKTEHLQEQAEMIEKLNARGYYATFCIGFDEAKKTIDNYFKGVL